MCKAALIHGLWVKLLHKDWYQSSLHMVLCAGCFDISTVCNWISPIDHVQAAHGLWMKFLHINWCQSSLWHMGYGWRLLWYQYSDWYQNLSHRPCVYAALKFSYICNWIWPIDHVQAALTSVYGSNSVTYWLISEQPMDTCVYGCFEIQLHM